MLHSTHPEDRKDVLPVLLQWKIQYIVFMLCRQACICMHEKAHRVCEMLLPEWFDPINWKVQTV